jgi:hypothetical protein
MLLYADAVSALINSLPASKALPIGNEDPALNRNSHQNRSPTTTTSSGPVGGARAVASVPIETALTFFPVR